MPKSLLRLTFVLLAMALALPMIAQEGHPLKGSWIGEWESNQELGESVIVVMDWNGTAVTGIVNPGTDNLQITRANLNPADWSVQIQAGDYMIEGKIENLFVPSRYITGTWKKGNAGGKFEIHRQ